MLQTNLLSQKLGREITVIMNDRIIVLALCASSSDDILLIYQVLFDSLLYFQRYTPDKLNIAKIRNGNNWNAGNRVMILAFCDSPNGPLSMYQSSLIPSYTSREMLPTSFLLQKLKREVTP